ncbi:MAG: alanine racemase [Blastocatellia bacterium]
MPDEYQHRPTRAEIDTIALVQNLETIRRIACGTPVMAVVKADAYGHGAAHCSRELQGRGVNWFAVATVAEALELRRSGIIGRILVLGGCWPGEERAFLENELTPAVFTLEQARRLDNAAADAGQDLRVHLKFDTGMGRVGFRFDAAEEIARQVAALRHLETEAVFSHFAAAEAIEQMEFTRLQNARLDEIVAEFKKSGIEPRYVDMANSPATVLYPESRRSIVRIGGLLYGLARDILPENVQLEGIRPVLSLRTQIAQVNTISGGETVGYGRSFVAESRRRIATLPIGYHDGLPRLLSNVGSVIVNGTSAPIVGRISMDWTTIDVTAAGNVDVGTDVIIIGRDGELEIRAEDIARQANTISYEITCGISRRVPRIYV